MKPRLQQEFVRRAALEAGKDLPDFMGGVHHCIVYQLDRPFLSSNSVVALAAYNHLLTALISVTKSPDRPLSIYVAVAQNSFQRIITEHPNSDAS